MLSLTPEQWAEIDAHIFSGYLAGVIQIRKTCGIGLNEAKDVFWMRYRQLRGERNAQFAKTDEEYCAGILE